MAVVALVTSACGSTALSVGAATETAAEARGELFLDNEFSLDNEGGLEPQKQHGLPPDDSSEVSEFADAVNGPSALRPGSSPLAQPGPGTGNSHGVPTAGTTGRGYTEKKVFIGMGTRDSAGIAGAMLGAGNRDYFGDQKAIANAIIKDINKRGGWAGREVVPVFYDNQEGAGSENSEAACAKWTQDRPVFAVVNTIAPFSTDILAACLAKHQIPFVDNYLLPPYQSTFTRFPLYYVPSGATYERHIPAWVRRGKAIGYFEGWDSTLGEPAPEPAKIGIWAPSADPQFNDLLTTALAEQGYSVAVRFESGVQDFNAAILRFKREGVTHVITRGSGILFITLLQNAESQQYRPRWLIDTSHNPEFTQTNGPRRQLPGLLGVGFAPALDVDGGNDPADDWNSSRLQCRKIMREAGQDDTQRFALHYMTSACDAFNFLGTAIARGDLSPRGVDSGVRTIQQMPSGAVFGISFKNGRRDGRSAVRDLAYRETCQCLRYLSKINHPV